MKNIFKYTACLLFLAGLLASCEELQDFGKVVDANDKIAYIDSNGDGIFRVTLTHSPAGSFLDLGESIEIRINTSLNTNTKVRFVVDNSLIEPYNEENATNYKAVPDSYVKLDAAGVNIPNGSDKAQISSWLSFEGDLSALNNEDGYLVPLRLESISGVKISEHDNIVYAVVEVETGNIRPLSSMDDVFANTVSNRSGWSSDITNHGNMVDGDAATYSSVSSNPGTFTVDLGEITSVTGIRLMVYSAGYVPNVKIEYGSNNADFELAGTATNAKYVTQSDASGRLYQYIMFYGAVDVRYLRITTEAWTNASYRQIYEFDVLQSSSTAQIYASATAFTGKIYHTPDGVESDFTAEFDVKTNIPSSEGYTVNVAMDNSLVSAYNTANGTNYTLLPASSLVIGNGKLTIGSMKYTSSSRVKVSLSNLSSLKDSNGYVAPLKISSPTAAGASDKDVVYLVIIPENNIILPSPTNVNLSGIIISDRSEWTSDVENILDGSTATYTAMNNPQAVNITMDKEYNVGSLKLYNYSASYVPEVKVEYSTDGVNYTSAGTADKGRYYVSGNNQYIVFITPVKAKQFRLTLNYSSESGNNRLYEVDVYETLGDKPLVYTFNDNLDGRIFHTPVGIDAVVDGRFFTYLSMSSPKETTVRITQDNSLIAAYNAANNTSYAAIPAGNIEIANATHKIPANKLYNTDAGVTVSLTGDLSGLTDIENDYLVPLKISSEQGSVEGKDVVYIIIDADSTNLIPTFDSYSIFGAELPRTTWTSSDAANVIDGNNSSGVSGATEMNIDMGSAQYLSGLRLYNSSTAAAQVPRLKIEYSTDGVNYEYAGISSAERQYLNSNNQYMMFYTPVHARYLRLTPGYTSGSNSVREVYAYNAEGEQALLYIPAGAYMGSIEHSAEGATENMNFQFYTSITSYGIDEASAVIEQDNSLVAAYNTANGTSFKTVPTENVKIDNANQVVRAGLARSLTAVSVSFTGDVSALNDVDNDYLIPIKITSDSPVSSANGIIYVVVDAFYNSIKLNPTQADVVGYLADKSGWTSTIANLIDGDTGNYTTNPGAFTISMGETCYVSGIRMYQRGSSYPAYPTISYSKDGSAYFVVGVAGTGRYFFNGNYQYIIFEEPVECNYLHITPNYTNTAARLYEVDVYDVETNSPLVYATAATGTINSTIIHTPVASINGVNVEFHTALTKALSSSVSATVLVDNTLIAAYNAANGTSYTAVPEANINLVNAAQSIDAGALQSTSAVKLTLTGDLTGLTSANGYLVPLKINSSTGVSRKKGIVYVAVMPGYNNIRENPTASDIIGSIVSDRSGWGPSQLANLFDGNTGTSVSSSAFPSGSATTIDLGQNYNISSLRFYAYYGTSSYYRPSTYYIQYSTDGVNYSDIGTATSSYIYLTSGYQNIVLYGAVSARYLKVTPSGASYYYGMAEFDIYAE